MAFTGYVFPSSTAISPYLEFPQTGPTSQFCKEIATRLGCHVVAGYPERLEPSELAALSAGGASTREAKDQDGNTSELVGANSAIMYGPEGQYLGGYRKTNLYETDKTWAIPGTGFASFTLPLPLRNVSLGICMDLNVQNDVPWTLDSGPYEFADHCAARSAHLVILLNAWLDSRENEDESEDWRVLNYWAMRLRPLWAKKDTDDVSERSERVVAVICNRTGEENDIKFAGCSSLYTFDRSKGKPRLLDTMGRTEEGVRIWNVNVDVS